MDLLLSRLIVEIARDPYLGEELIFRGGTCLHKLHANKAHRYSEDLDYVRRSDGGIGEVTRAASAIGERLGMEVRTQIGQHPKIFLRAPFESGDGRMRIKIEVNTFERSPARDLVRLPHSVESPWFTGTADVLTFCPAELVSTSSAPSFGDRRVETCSTCGSPWCSSTSLRMTSSTASPRAGRRATRALVPSRTSVPSS